jgi:MFS family permease
MPPQTAGGALAPIMAVVFIGFLVIGMAIPVLPLHVHDNLGYGPFMVGLVAGCQFAVSLVSRVWSGRASDMRGAKYAVMIGLAAAVVAGLLYLLSLSMREAPPASVAILLAGRALMGGAESFIITGATAWGLSAAGPENAGKVIAWMGTAMFAAFAAGAPLGSALYDRVGFLGIALVTTVIPLATLGIVARLQAVAPAHKGGASIFSVVRMVWMPGCAAALSSVGYGSILAFISLLFVEHGWRPVWLAFSAYAVALIVARLLFGHLPDRLGGARVALVSILIEAAGLAMIWMASSATIAALGAAITGLGYALAFPSLGVEVVRRAPPEARGLAMGAYTACLDVALGFGTPALGLIASVAGLGAVFITSTFVVLLSVAIAIRILGDPAQPAVE